MKTYIFRYKTQSSIKITILSYDEQSAWLELDELVYDKEKWELSK
jgi:hypothetical protein